ncbi:MAG: hypothetical protein Q9225_005651, partial [Loekoesia sp. 1 TL-2023]
MPTNPSPTTDPLSPNSKPITPPSTNDTSLLSPRSGRQFSIFLVGAASVGLTIFSTRRALLRRYIATVPYFFQPSNAPPRQPFSLQREAFEALKIATINVL